ncbi:unnamed protein product [Paramecium primaurelia]|uniref:Thioredoxin domain-containing protein n=1 Tax=Paramecium primaurelia TaxID=5886 RepID=A0A8S1LAE1_PARPR|nr:unnamed protein product [Paramecium primaurelia]
MKGQYYSLKRKINTSSQLLRSNQLLSLAETNDQIQKNKTDSQLSNSHKKISRSINNLPKKDPNLDLAFMTITKPDSRYDFSKFPNLEKKTDVQRVNWFTKQNKQIEQQQNFLEFLNATRTQSTKNQTKTKVNVQQNKIDDKNELNYCDKYFVIKTPIKPILIKQKNTKLISMSSTMSRIKKKALNRNMNLEQFIEKNNELRRHCQTQQEHQYTQNSILEQLQIKNIQHINLYSSVKRGIKNNILHNQYKSEIKDLIELDDELTIQDYETIKELQKKSIFQNPFSNPHHNEINQFNSQSIDNNTKINEQNQNEQLLIIQKRKNKIKRVLLQITLFLHWMIEHKLKYEDIITGNVFQTKPYQSEKSKLCFQKVKANDIDLVNQFINHNKYLVYDYDNFKLTMLHHAVIRDYPEMAILILQNHAEINSKDIQGRTPLFYAIKGKCNQCVLILLYYKASPWGNVKNTYDKYLEFLDPKVRDLYKKAKTRTLLVIIKINIYIQMIILILFLISFSYAHDWDENTKVKLLNEEQYDLLNKDEGIFIMFYAPWCPHCIKLIPTWEIQGQQSNTAAVNCEQHSQLCSRFKIKGFPSLIYIPPQSKFGYKFYGNRTNDEFDLFIKGGWQKEGILQIEILSEYTLVDQIIDYLKDPMFIGVIVVMLFLIFMICCMNRLDSEREEIQKNKQQKVQKKED